LVVVAVHQGPLAAPAGVQNGFDYSYDFRVLPAVDEWNTVWGITGYPAGVINRTKFNGSYLSTYSSWDGRIEGIANTSPEAILKINNYFNSTSGKYTARINTKFKTAMAGNYKISVFIIEDSIIKPQKNNDPTIGTTPDIGNYVHMHTLRAVVNSTWGESIGTNNIAAGSEFNNNYTLTLKTEWVVKHLSVVALIYDANDYHIVQAAWAPLDSR